MWKRHLSVAKLSKKASVPTSVAKHVSEFEKFFHGYNQKEFNQEPAELFKPCAYILELPAKRIRPALVLLGHEIFNPKLPQTAYEVAAAVEVFHNYTLVHDDIMDESPIRRGLPTVHEKWGVNAGILSGDFMFIRACQAFHGLEASVMKECLSVFLTTAEEVVVGQTMDMSFETRDVTDLVSEAEYIEMIRLKTSVLLACALKLGAIISGAPGAEAQKLYNYGLNLGIAFQIQDDFLDLWGEQAKVGKRIGGDIYDNKKTLLYIRAMEHASETQKEELIKQFSVREEDPQKLATVKNIFEELKVDELIKKEMWAYQAKALECLYEIETSESKEALDSLSAYLIQREL